jgi:DNA-binding transcriptional regulator YdaS (Cro superfamily)
MQLKDFVKMKRGEQRRLANLLGISPTWMNLLVSGKRDCSPELALGIEAATNGQVTRAELRPDLFGDIQK